MRTIEAFIKNWWMEVALLILCAHEWGWIGVYGWLVLMTAGQTVSRLIRR